MNFIFIQGWEDYREEGRQAEGDQQHPGGGDQPNPLQAQGRARCILWVPEDPAWAGAPYQGVRGLPVRLRRGDLHEVSWRI